MSYTVSIPSIIVTLMVLILAGCSSTGTNLIIPEGPIARDGPPAKFNPAKIIEVTPKHEAKARYGNHSPYVVFGKTYHVKDSSLGYEETGIASWYGSKFHGRRTSSWEPYDLNILTAAHKSLPLPTYVEVTNLNNQRSIIVKVNDRGPFHDKRIIDLSYAAAYKLGFVDDGTAPVRVRSIDTRDNLPKPHKNSILSAQEEPSPVTEEPYKSAAEKTVTTSVVLKNATLSQENTQFETRKQLFVQAGAFSFLEYAHNLEKNLRSITTVPVIIKQKTAQGVHRVHLGPFNTEADAMLVADVIRQQNIGLAVLVWD